MLQKLENAYLAILRMTVIIVSGILLVGVIVFGLGSLEYFNNSPNDKIKSPKINSETIIKKITATENVPTESVSAGSDSKVAEPSKDQNEKLYISIAKKIKEFIDHAYDFKYPQTAEEYEKDLKMLVDHIRKISESGPGRSNELALAYATKLSLATNQILSDKKIEEIAINSDPLNFVDKFLDAFTEEFNRQFHAEQDRIQKEQQEYIQTKAKSINNLYIAAASFGIFIIVVFLSIFIKIERNLRCLEVRSHADTSTT
jgi:hypothetical protein